MDQSFFSREAKKETPGHEREELIPPKTSDTKFSGSSCTQIMTFFMLGFSIAFIFFPVYNFFQMAHQDDHNSRPITIPAPAPTQEVLTITQTQIPILPPTRGALTITQNRESGIYSIKGSKVGALLNYLAADLEDEKKMKKVVKHIQHVNSFIQDQVHLIHVVFDFKNKSPGYAKQWKAINDQVISKFTNLVEDLNLKTEVEFEFLDMQSEFGKTMSTEIFDCTKILIPNEKICNVTLMFKNSMAYFWGMQRLRNKGFELAFHMDSDWGMLARKTEGAANDFVEFSAGILKQNPNILSVHLYNNDEFSNRFNCRFNGTSCVCERYLKREDLPHYHSWIKFRVKESHVLHVSDGAPICGEHVQFTCNIFMVNISKWFQNAPFHSVTKHVESMIHADIVSKDDVPVIVAFNYSGHVKIPFWNVKR